MLEDEEMRDDGAQIGYCAFCHQGMAITTVGEVSQTVLNEMATKKCECPDAKSERRKIERRQKVDTYVENNFEPDSVPTIKSLIQLIEHREFDSVTINHGLSGWKITIKTDKDGYLIITKKRTVQGESLRE